MADTDMTDAQALRYVPTSMIFAGLFSLGVTLISGASWRFGLGLTIILGMGLWMLVVADENKKRRQRAVELDGEGE